MLYDQVHADSLIIEVFVAVGFSKTGMLALLSLVACQSTILQDFTNETFVATQSFAGSVNFYLCTFNGCTTNSSGGAFYVQSSSASILVVSCYFVNCRVSPSTTESSGGAFFIQLSHDFSFRGSTVWNCTASDYNGAFSLIVALVGPVSVYESSAVLCSSKYDTIYLCCGVVTASERVSASVEALNVTDNAAGSYGAGINVEQIFRCVIRFTTFARNGPRNLLIFGAMLPEIDVSCLLLENNSCESHRYMPGFLSVREVVTLTTCIFRGNRIDWLVGTGIRPEDNGSITFIGCVFDFVALNTTGTISLSSSACSHTDNTNFSIKSCPWPLPSVQETGSGDEPENEMFGLSLGIFVGIIAGSVVGGGLIAVLVILAVLRARNRKTSYSPGSASDIEDRVVESRTPHTITILPPPAG
jgi:hypothetical protein